MLNGMSQLKGKTEKKGKGRRTVARAMLLIGQENLRFSGQMEGKNSDQKTVHP